MQRLALSTVLVSTLVSSCDATTLVPRLDDAGERLIDKLANAPDLRCTYHDDGAADASVLQNPVPEVLALLKLGRRVVPLLIDHLDDVRQTTARYDGGRFRSDPLHVSVGYVCLDILAHVVQTKMGIVRKRNSPALLNSDCADDGLGVCVEQRYYFHPTVFTPSKDSLQQRKPVRVAKANWTAALRNGWVRFEYPRWLKNASDDARTLTVAAHVTWIQ